MSATCPAPGGTSPNEEPRKDSCISIPRLSAYKIPRIFSIGNLTTDDKNAIPDRSSAKCARPGSIQETNVQLLSDEKRKHKLGIGGYRMPISVQVTN
jgi:hypothetical protein